MVWAVPAKDLPALPEPYTGVSAPTPGAGGSPGVGRGPETANGRVRGGSRQGTTADSGKERAESTMIVRPRLRPARRALLAIAAAVTLALAGLLAGGAASPSRAATAEPCDIYA